MADLLPSSCEDFGPKLLLAYASALLPKQRQQKQELEQGSSDLFHIFTVSRWMVLTLNLLIQVPIFYFLCRKLP